jgi:hypothetical protein
VTARRRGAASALLVAGLAGAAGLLAAHAAPAAASGTPEPSGPERVVERTVTDPDITESSGLVASTLTPGVLWTFNDSGNDARLFAVGEDGGTVGVHTVDGGAPEDWEAATALTGPDGEPLLAVGDIGDNDGERKRVEVHLLDEPATDGESDADPRLTLELTYPDQPVDAEALVADPGTGRLYVVSKGLLGGRVYGVPESAWPGDGLPAPGAKRKQRVVEAELELLGRVPLVLVTDGVALPDGRVALRTYTDLSLMPPLSTLDDPDAAWTPLATVALPRQGQGEGVGLAADGTFLLSTEGVNKPVLAFTEPQEFRAVDAPSPDPDPSVVASPAPDDLTGSAVSRRAFLLMIGAALLAVAVVAVGAVLRMRRTV